MTDLIENLVFKNKEGYNASIQTERYYQFRIIEDM